MRLTDEQLHILIASNPSDPEALAELRSRLLAKLHRALPAPTGTCSAGLPVMLDCKGVYSTGHWLHSRAGISTYCNHTDPKTGTYTGEYEIAHDPDSPHRARLKRLIAGLNLDKLSKRP